MLDQEEINAVVWEALARHKSPLGVDALMVETGVAKGQISAAVGRLREAGLVSLHDAPPSSTFLASIVLDAWRWAQAVDLGIPLTILERHASLPAKQRKDALKVAGRGEVEAARVKRREEQADARREFLQGRAASKAAATDLARLADDAKAAYQKALHEKRDAITCSLLKQMYASAQGCLDRLRKALEEA